jgi:hypothetical protein
MRRFTTAVIALSFLAGVVGMAQAQTPAPATTDKPADKVEKMEKPADKKAGDKKPAEKTAKSDKAHKGHTTDAAKPAVKPAEKAMDKPAEKAPATPAPTTTEKK